MSDQMKNLLIGIFVSGALGIIIFMILFLHPYIGDEGQVLRVRFPDINKVTVGTRVSFAGKPIGEVMWIRPLEDVRLGRTEHKGEIYVYELGLGIDSGIKVYNTDKISVHTSGLLGEKSIAIDPEPLQPGQELRVVNKEILYAADTGSLEDTFKEFKKVAEKIDTTLDTIHEALQELEEKDVWENLATTVENMNNITTRLADSWDDVDDSIANAAKTVNNVLGITEKMKGGEGTIGKLLTTEDFYLRTTSLLSKGETIMDDINHYGILFHLDKGWQRLRARRMNLLQKLQSPQEFRNFFNDEINRVSTSLSRVSLLLDKSECYYPYLMENCEFQKVFSELMRRVNGLEEELKMYNIQLMECQVKQTELAR
ncbi:MAG: MlaD family protein [Waddliaceae bacterium]